MQAQQVGIPTWRAEFEQGRIEIDFVRLRLELHRATEQVFILGKIGAPGAAQAQPQRWILTLGDRLSEADRLIHHADLRVAQLRRLHHRPHHGEARALVVLHQADIDGVADQAQVLEGTLATLTEGAAAEEQVLDHLATEYRQMRAQVQADIGIAGNPFDDFPEKSLQTMRRTQVALGQAVGVIAQSIVDRGDVKPGLDHSRMHHLQEHARIPHRVSPPRARAAVVPAGHCRLASARMLQSQ